MASKGTDRQHGRGRVVAGLLAGCMASAGPTAAGAETVVFNCWVKDRPTGYIQVRADSDSHSVELQSYPHPRRGWIVFRDGSQSYNLCPDPDYCPKDQASRMEALVRGPIAKLAEAFTKLPGGKATIIPVQQAELTDAIVAVGFGFQISAVATQNNVTTHMTFMLTAGAMIDRATKTFSVVGPALTGGHDGEPEKPVALSHDWDGLHDMIAAQFKDLTCGADVPTLYPEQPLSNDPPVHGDPGLTRQGK